MLCQSSFSPGNGCALDFTNPGNFPSTSTSSAIDSILVIWPVVWKCWRNKAASTGSRKIARGNPDSVLQCLGLCPTTWQNRCNCCRVRGPASAIDFAKRAAMPTGLAVATLLISRFGLSLSYSQNSLRRWEPSAYRESHPAATVAETGDFRPPLNKPAGLFPDRKSGPPAFRNSGRAIRASQRRLSNLSGSQWGYCWQTSDSFQNSACDEPFELHVWLFYSCNFRIKF